MSRRRDFATKVIKNGASVEAGGAKKKKPQGAARR